ncbi:hypothetical protein LTR85_005565 [Meristemomyces frigidus]|nr:hypothetical protein LTR85_005565 [Meristemomyces frigidus]
MAASEMVPYSDDMDVSDDDGGVPLDISSRPTFDLAIRTQGPQTENQPSSSRSLELATQGESQYVNPFTPPQDAYFQDPSVLLVHGAQLWRLPVEPTLLANAHDMQNVIDSMTGHIFDKSCKLIQQNWECEPLEALPNMLHESTPYSLALLLQLRMLASYSKKDRVDAQAILVNQWQNRMNLLALAGQDFGGQEYGRRTLQTTAVMHVNGIANPQHMQYCEQIIQENIFGLTLDDVAKALVIAKHVRKSSKNGGGRAAKQSYTQARPQYDNNQQQRRQKDAGQQDEDEAKKRKLEARRAQKQDRLTAKAHGQAAELLRIRAQVASGEIPIRVSKRLAKQRAANSAPAAPLTMQDIRAERLAMIRQSMNIVESPPMDVEVSDPRPEDSTESGGPEDMAYETFSKQDKKAYNTMTWMLDSSLRVQEERGNGRQSRKRTEKKERTLQALAESGGRKGSDLVNLPSERVDFSSLPALHARLGNVKEQEMAEAMRALELAQLGQEPLPLPSAPQGTSYNISKDDDQWFRQ